MSEREVTVHLVRHGEVHNPDRVVYGRLPGYHLSERGRRQAAQAARHLHQEARPQAILSSPLERAQETAEVIAKLLALEVSIDDRLIETASHFEGLVANVRALVASPRRWWELRNPFRPSWGESFSDIRERMLGVVRETLDEDGGDDFVFVSHQTPILVARLALARRGVPPWLGRIPCETGSVTTLRLQGEALLSASYFAPPG